MAGIIGNGMKLSNLGTPGDFNKMVEVGCWNYWGLEVANAPDKSDLAYGRRVVLISAEDKVFEFFYSLNNYHLYFRGRKWNSEWIQLI